MGSRPYYKAFIFLSREVGFSPSVSEGALHDTLSTPTHARALYNHVVEENDKVDIFRLPKTRKQLVGHGFRAPEDVGIVFSC